MWQRIQTVFLVIAILCLVASIFFPLWTFRGAEVSHELYPLHYTMKNVEEPVTEYFPYSLTAVLIVAAAVIALIEITKFKDRVLQMKLGALNSLFMAGAIFSAVYFGNTLTNALQGGEYGLIGMVLLGVAVICNFLANRFIRRDERLVRSSERLR